MFSTIFETMILKALRNTGTDWDGLKHVETSDVDRANLVKPPSCEAVASLREVLGILAACASWQSALKDRDGIP